MGAAAARINVAEGQALGCNTMHLGHRGALRARASSCDRPHSGRGRSENREKL